ncbi:peroxisomal biogenesis factor 11 [Suhomyces tanzawaensis NRRL Y-17324]|uniref:Peroxisomal biogenesis factor 11 n=1 Tax=Suhomyces tanzawaensis NRRL Y-17324 TaxID=984487 RepID=A0A1E4SR27_9ASCO|nr:peroxisomal biogenesis factor 11 [Suhomyces tanzawaensis NRRL Y-17324]ODV81959.1 peroxisomal biogenesis factor 11 [Suhomyces tanzawaensis NRRL Y-17324]
MVADAVIYHPTFAKLIKFLDSTPKREKAFRLVAYLSRFLGYYLARKGYPAEWVRLFKDLKSNVTFIRKGMRFLKPLNHLQTAAQTYDNKLLDPVLRSTTVLRNLSYAAYLGLDSITFFKLLGIVDKKRFPTVSTWGSRFWLLGLIAGLINSVHTISTLNKYKSEQEKPEQKEAVDKKIYKAKRKWVWDLLDAFVALNSLDYLHFSEGDVGLAGTVTSLMGLSDLWAAT